MFWPAFIGGAGFGAVAMIFLLVAIKVFAERTVTRSTEADFETGE